MLRMLIRNHEKIMAKLDDLIADITAETTLIDSVATLISGLRAQIAAALSNTALPPDVQAKIDAAFAQLEANKAALTAAIATNTPASAAPAA